MKSIRRTSAGAALAAVVVLAGCGGSSSSSVSASDYVKSVCNAVGTFRKNVQNKTASLSSVSVTSPGQGKKALEDFLSSAASEANAAASKLKSAGTPDVSNGKQISSSLVNAFNQLGSSLKQAGASASSLSTASAAAFKSGFLTIQNNIRNSLSGLLSGLSSLHSTQLSQAAKKEPACTSLAG